MVIIIDKLNTGWSTFLAFLSENEMLHIGRTPCTIDGSGMIFRTMGRTIMLSQVGFPTINRHQPPYPVPMFVRYRHHRRRSVPSAAVCATGLDLGHGVSSAQLAGIRTMGWHPPHRPRSEPSAAICAGTLKRTKQSRSLRWLQIQARNGSN
jgi:hypothetical protein